MATVAKVLGVTAVVLITSACCKPSTTVHLQAFDADTESFCPDDWYVVNEKDDRFEVVCDTDDPTCASCYARDARGWELDAVFVVGEREITQSFAVDGKSECYTDDLEATATFTEVGGS